MSTIAISGGTGFAGRHLVRELTRLGEFRVRVLSRRRKQDLISAEFGAGIDVFQGDLRVQESLHGFLEPDCIAVNLAYLRDGGENENILATTNFLEACKTANIRRLIHCSTADVVGRAPDNLVTESTPCRPGTGYGVTKLKVERAVLDAARGHFDSAILRPTAVFGPGGENLKKLTGNLVARNRLRNYLKSCLFSSRRMNLVYVANVVAAILFLAYRAANLGGQVFIISDDDNPSNNFADVERILMREINIPDYSLPRLQIPPLVLAIMLRCLGRDNTNPRRNYSPDKLIRLGFERPVSLEAGLAEYAAWYRSPRRDG